MSSYYIYMAITTAALATYLCRALGVLFASKIKINSSFFKWIKCVSMGVIVAVISRIIFYPIGVLETTTLESRIIATICLILTYFILKRNILLSVIISTIIFTACNQYPILIFSS